MTTTGRRRGRPPRSAEEPSICAIQVRVPAWLYDDLSAEAEANGRSLSAQAERRLLHRESHLTRIVGALVDDAEKRLRTRGEQDQEIIDQECRRVAHVAVEIVYGTLEGPTDADIERLTRIKIKSEYEQLENDVWAPFRLAEVKNGSALPK